MRLTTLPAEFHQARPVMNRLLSAGYEAYFVGGSVRDFLLRQSIHDVDIATSAFPAEVKEIFHKTIDVGIQHGTVMVLEHGKQYEITTFRTESTYQDFRRPDHVEFVRSLEEDLKRRDFTINALAVAENGTVIDLFDGLKDLDEKRLRAVGKPRERFHEDALRMMRGLRFVSQLGFQLDEPTAEAICENHQLLAKISVERIFVEFEKLLLGTWRKAGLEAFVATGCYVYCPGLSAHKDGLLLFSDYPSDRITEPVLAWTLLCRALGFKESDVQPFFKKWKASNQLIQEVAALLTALNIRLKRELTLKELYHLGLSRSLQIEELIYFYGQTPAKKAVAKRYDSLVIRSLKELAVNGRDLMSALDRASGPWLREYLQKLEAAVIWQQVPNTREALLDYAKQLS